MYQESAILQTFFDRQSENFLYSTKKEFVSIVTCPHENEGNFRGLRRIYSAKCIRIDRMEVLNAELQKSDLSINESYKKVEAVMVILTKNQQAKFDKAWSDAFKDDKDLNLEEPSVSRQRRAL